MEEFALQPEACSQETRPAQIPVGGKRFDYLINQYKEDASAQFTMKHEPGHFVIFDSKFGKCIFDSKYTLLRSNCTEDEIVAVITEITINHNKLQQLHYNKSEFALFADLILRDL